MKCNEKCLCKKCIYSCKCVGCLCAVTYCEKYVQYKQTSLFDKSKKKLLRDYTWNDYGRSKERYHELKTYCRSADKDMLMDIAKRVDDLCAEYLVLSVSQNLSFEGVESKIAQTQRRIPVGRTEFYALRRLFYNYLNEKIA